MDSLGLAPEDSGKATQMFLRDRPGYRLGSLFTKFPVLARLWSLAISQWRNHTTEVLARSVKDRRVISRLFFKSKTLGKIKNVWPGLSDPHRGGRTVTLIEFERGPLVYKPRSGTSEINWFSLLSWMNRHGFRPKHRVVQVLGRTSYSWMEYVEPASCENQVMVRRFYKRVGGLIAAAYVLKAVDCHRENLIAAGEYPVLVDVDALWQVAPHTRKQTLTDILYRTGFFPDSQRTSLQSRSSVLGPAKSGTHLARVAAEPVVATDYADEIISGFVRGWHCLVGTSRRRAATQQRISRLRAQRRRWIYRATERYEAIRQASIEPVALRGAATRDALITRACIRSNAKWDVVRAEIKALKQLDLPYFVRRTNEPMPAEPSSLPSELLDAIRNALEWGRGVTRKGANSSRESKSRSGNLRRCALPPRRFEEE